MGILNKLLCKIKGHKYGKFETLLIDKKTHEWKDGFRVVCLRCGADK